MTDAPSTPLRLEEDAQAVLPSSRASKEREALKERNGVLRTLPKSVALDIGTGEKVPTPRLPGSLLKRLTAEAAVVSGADLAAKQEAAARRRHEHLATTTPPPRAKHVSTCDITSRRSAELSESLASRISAADSLHQAELERKATSARRETVKAARAAEEARRADAESRAKLALKSAEKQLKAEKRAAEIEATRIETARKLAGGDMQGKAMREALVEQRIEQRATQLDRESRDRLRLAAERAALQQQHKVEVARKSAGLDRKDAVEKSRREAADIRAKEIAAKHELAAARSKQAEFAKIKKARKELDKCDLAFQRAAQNRDVVSQRRSSCFFDPPHGLSHQSDDDDTNDDSPSPHRINLLKPPLLGPTAQASPRYIPEFASRCGCFAFLMRPRK